MSRLPEAGTPWLVRLLVRGLPSRVRRRWGEPLEAAIAEALAEAGARGRWSRARVLAREVAALAVLVLRERMDDGVPRRPWEGWGTEMMGQDVRAAFRSLLRGRGTAVVSVGTMAVAIGAMGAIASVMDGVLLRNLSYGEPDRVLYIGERTPDGGYTSTSWENLRDWQASGIFEAVAATLGNSVSVTGIGVPERIRGEFVSASYFRVVGVEPVVGRGIGRGEDEPGGPRTAVLSWGWWQQRFGGDPAVLGTTALLNNHPHTIVGVMPAGFRSPWDTPQAWISLQTAPGPPDRETRRFQAVMARLHPDQSPESARASLQGLAASLAREHPDANAGYGAWAEPLGAFLAERNRPFLLGLGAAVCLLLLIACANVANLQLARSAARRRELAVRMALGGGRRRILRLLLVENAVLFLLGGVAGVGVARLGVEGLLRLEPDYTAFYDVRLSLAAVGLAMAVAVASGLLFGLIPAWEALRTAPAAALREGGRGSGPGRGGQRFRSGLVVAQMALSMGLLVGGALLARTMSALMGVHPGFESERLLTLEFRLPANRYETDASRRVFFDRLAEELQAIPGIEGIGFANDLPFSGNGGATRLLPEGSALEWDDAPVIRTNNVSPGYRATMGIPLLEGRDLEEADGPDAPTALLVSRSVAERWFEGGRALGKRLYVTPDRSVSGTIVGIVGDVRTTLTDPPEPYVYVSYRQYPSGFMSVAVRTAGDPMTVAPAVRDAVWRVDPDQPVWEVMPITERMAGSASRTRFNAVLVGVFATTALLLAMLGLYGVTAHSVRQRERELGVRLALGAEPGAVMRLVLRRGMALTATGLALGALLGAWLAGLLRTLLFGVPPLDPWSFVAAAAVLAAVATVAAWLPARRALALDPAGTLHEG